MSHTPHELSEQFPNKEEQIHLLKVSDPHFAKLAERYHDLNREVHRAETGIAPMEQLAETDLRKERMRLLDEIAKYLN